MLTLILGGARSGKSRYAQSLLGDGRVIYVATARPDNDEEMRARIARHRADRPTSWITIEEPERVPDVVRCAAPSDAPVLVECLTLWLSNLFMHQADAPIERHERELLDAVRQLADAARTRDVVVVSNEIGSGVVPMTVIGRRFRDLQGRANQVLAADAGQVVLVVAGLPIAVKGSNRIGPT